MNALAMIAILMATPLVQSTVPEGSGCKAALRGLAAAAHAAELATENADDLVARIDQLRAKVDACRKENGKNGSGCAKAEKKLEATEAEFDGAEELLTAALEGVDTAYDDFDVACSWDDPETNVQVRNAAGSAVGQREANRSRSAPVRSASAPSRRDSATPIASRRESS